jgi:hypothetical protein
MSGNSLASFLDFFYSDWDSYGVPNPEILTSLARIVTDNLFSDDLGRQYHRFVVIVETDAYSSMIPAAITVLSAMATSSESLRGNLDFQAAVEGMILHRPTVDFVPLCLALVTSSPFPSPQLLRCLTTYILQFIPHLHHPSFPDAVHFAALCVRNELPFSEFSPFCAEFSRWLSEGNIQALGAVLEYCCASGHFTDAICDAILERVTAFQSPSAVKAAVCASQLFVMHQDQLNSRSASVIHFFLNLVPHAAYTARTAAVLGFLGYVGDVPFDADTCQFLLEFIDVPVASRRIFHIFLRWIETASEDDVAEFAKIVAGRRDEIVDFISSSDLPEHRLFDRYLPLLEDYAAVKGTP